MNIKILDLFANLTVKHVTVNTKLLIISILFILEASWNMGLPKPLFKFHYNKTQWLDSIITWSVPC